MSDVIMGGVGITRYINDKAGLVEYRIRPLPRPWATAGISYRRRPADAPPGARRRVRRPPAPPVVDG